MNESSEDSDTDQLPPKKRLEGPTRLVNAGIESIEDMDMLRECVAYENANQNRSQILHRLELKADELRADDQ